MDHFGIVLALARRALAADQTEISKHQIRRLRDALRSVDTPAAQRQAVTLTNMLERHGRPAEPFKLIHS